MKSLDIIACLILLGTPLMAQQGSAHSTKLDAGQAAFFNQMSDELICQCGCNLVLSGCGHVNCPSAIPMRTQIEDMILAGKGRDAILAYFTNEYRYNGNPPQGRRILSQPETKGFDLLAWTMPFVLLGVFLVIIISVVRKSSRKTVPVEMAAKPDGLDERIEQELKKLE